MINSSCFHNNNRVSVSNNEIHEESFLKSNKIGDNLVIYVRNDMFNNINN